MQCLRNLILSLYYTATPLAPVNLPDTIYLISGCSFTLWVHLYICYVKLPDSRTGTSKDSPSYQSVPYVISAVGLSVILYYGVQTKTSSSVE